MTDIESFGDRLRSRREKKALKRDDVATRCGISYKTLANLEAGRSWPSMPVYISLCRLLGVGKVPLVEA